MSSVMTSFSRKRVVALVDMDCFYVQVVQRKDPSLKEKPCAVVQYNLWKGGGIIAVGYKARKCGVTRQMRGDEAKRKCPDIQLVQVPESRGKADLTLFRDAGAEVIEVLAQFTDCLERASIDEAYLDLTNIIENEMQNYPVEEVAMDTFKNTHLVGYDNKEFSGDESAILGSELFKAWLEVLKNNQNYFRLAIGAVIAHKMRQAVTEKTGFSCSAGVGPNKMLAKIVAGFHKPNQQTLVLPDNISGMFESTKMRKIRSLGGKLGQQLEDQFKVEFMSQLVPITLSDLQRVVGAKNGNIVYWLCRGVDHEPVRPRQLPQSVGCSKNFRGKLTLRTKDDVYKWLTNLCEEVYERLEKEKSNNARVPTLFTVGCTSQEGVNQSRRFNVIKIDMTSLRDEALQALSGFNTDHASPSNWSPAIINLHLSCGKFVETGGNKSIANSFSKQNNVFNNNIVNKSLMSTSSSEVLSDEASFCDIVASNNSNTKTNNSINNNNNNINNTAISSKPKKPDISKYFSSFNENIHTDETRPNSATTSVTMGNNSSLVPKQTPTSLKNHRNNEEKSNLLKKPFINAMDSFFAKARVASSTVTGPPTLPLEEHPLLGVKTNTVSASTTSRSDKPPTTSVTSSALPSRSSTSNNAKKDNKTNCNQRSTIDRLLSNQRNNNNLFQRRHDEDRALASSSSSSSSSSIDDLMSCERCGKRLLVWDLPDHMDFHFAKDLQDSLKENFFTMCGNSSSSSSSTSNNIRKDSSLSCTKKRLQAESPLKKPSKKIKNSDEINDSSNQRLLKYFSPIIKKHNEP